jgi:alpha-1,3-rhamnosyl/mannosyltransferase
VGYHLIRWLPAKVFNAIVRKVAAPPVDLMLMKRPDLFIFTNFVRYPLAFRTKAIVIVYDLSFLSHAEYTTKRNRKYLTRYVPRSLERSQHVITISENARRELMDRYRVPAEKITIIYPSIDHDRFFPRHASEAGAVAAAYGITRPYVLFTGTLEPRKNILGILTAYSLLPEHLQKQYTLVLAGGKGWLDRDIRRALEQRDDLDVVTTGYVPDEDLPALYSGASLFVYPSHYEGFGMPPLEAMACGVPVIAANNSSLPEVVGDAGILIESTDAKLLAMSIEQVLTQPSLAKEMAAKGLLRAKQFSWESGAAKLLDVIHAVEEMK